MQIDEQTIAADLRARAEYAAQATLAMSSDDLIRRADDRPILRLDAAGQPTTHIVVYAQRGIDYHTGHGGYLPRILIDGEVGSYPARTFQQAGYAAFFGTVYADARDACDRINALLGRTPDETLVIVARAMRRTR